MSVKMSVFEIRASLICYLFLFMTRQHLVNYSIFFCGLIISALAHPPPFFKLSFFFSLPMFDLITYFYLNHFRRFWLSPFRLYSHGLFFHFKEIGLVTSTNLLLVLFELSSTYTIHKSLLNNLFPHFVMDDSSSGLTPHLCR